MKKSKQTSTTQAVLAILPKQKLTKAQAEFNKLTARIEKLQKDIQKKQENLDNALLMYGAQLHPQKAIISAARREFLMALCQNYITDKLAKKDQQILKEIIVDVVQRYLMELTAPPDDAVKKIVTILSGSDYDKMYAKEKNEARNDIINKLKKAKVDLSDIDKKDMEALQNRYMQYMAEENLAEEKSTFTKSTKQKPKSAKQVAAEKLQADIANAQQKNIATIYKQLAKLFHPDLEQDENRKLEKELLMKELTAAYEAKNLHALLTLELRWIHGENDHLATLTDEKLAIYLQILKEQAYELSVQKNEMIYQPQYYVLMEEFGYAINQNPLLTIYNTVRKMDELEKDLKYNAQLLLSAEGLRHLKKMIKEKKKLMIDDDFVVMLNDNFR